MVNFIVGWIGLLFFGGGLIHVFINKRDELDLKKLVSFFILIASSILLIFISDILPGGTVEMVTGDETFKNKDTIVAGDYEYTVTNKGTVDALEDFGSEIPAQGEYLIFEIDIKNNSNYPYKMDTLMDIPFYIVNGGRFYEVNKELSRSLSNEELSSQHLWSRTGSTNPGNTVSGYIVFDMPKEIIESKETQLLVLTDDSAPNDIYVDIN